MRAVDSMQLCSVFAMIVAALHVSRNDCYPPAIVLDSLAFALEFLLTPCRTLLPRQINDGRVARTTQPRPETGHQQRSCRNEVWRENLLNAARSALRAGTGMGMGCRGPAAQAGAAVTTKVAAKTKSRIRRRRTRFGLPRVTDMNTRAG